MRDEIYRSKLTFMFLCRATSMCRCTEGLWFGFLQVWHLVAIFVIHHYFNWRVCRLLTRSWRVLVRNQGDTFFFGNRPPRYNWSNIESDVKPKTNKHIHLSTMCVTRLNWCDSSIGSVQDCQSRGPRFVSRKKTLEISEILFVVFASIPHRLDCIITG